MAAVPRPRRRPGVPKPLQGEGHPEVLLRAATQPAPTRATRGPNATWRSWPPSPVSGLRSAELLSLTVASMTGSPASGESGSSARAANPGQSRSRTPWTTSSTVTSPPAESASRPPGSGPAAHCSWTPVANRCSAAACDTSSTRPCAPPASATAAPRRPGPRPTTYLRHPPGRRRRYRQRNHGLARPRIPTTSQAYIDSTAVEQRRSAAANRTYRAIDGILK